MIRCLIADDSQTMRKIIRANLEKHGIKKVEEANDGAQTIRKFTSMKSVDLMFLDINMPIKSGKEVVEILASRKMLDETRIVIISTDLGADNKEFFFRYNITDFIPKPFNLEVFNKIVEPLLQSTTEPKESIDSTVKSLEKSLNEMEFKVESHNGSILLSSDNTSILIDIKKAILAGVLQIEEDSKTKPSEDMNLLKEKL